MPEELDETQIVVLGETVLNRLAQTVLMGRRRKWMIMMMIGSLRAMLSVH